MAHVTYEERFIEGNNDFKYLLKCHPDFCKICFSKMYQSDTPGGGTELRTDLKDRDGESMFEPDGYGGASKVSVRPHIAQGTACGWGNTSSSVGANLWHATTWGNKLSMCQHGDTLDEAVETMFVRPGGKFATLTAEREAHSLKQQQLVALVNNPKLMSAKGLRPSIDGSMPED